VPSRRAEAPRGSAEPIPAHDLPVVDARRDALR